MSSNALQSTQAVFTPRRLILELLDEDPSVIAQSKQLLAAGELLGFSTNQMRVSFSRLVADD